MGITSKGLGFFGSGVGKESLVADSIETGSIFVCAEISDEVEPKNEKRFSNQEECPSRRK